MSKDRATIFLDVNETLSDFGGVADAFDQVCGDRDLSERWFSAVLRDGFALAVARSPAKLAEIARNNAYVILSDARLDVDIDEGVDRVMKAFGLIGLHSDVPGGLSALHHAGHSIFTLSNGPASTAEKLLSDVGLLDMIDGILTVEGHTQWKPSSAAYLDAIGRTGVAGLAYLVSVHPWDIHGASVAGLSSVWINRSAGIYPAHFRPATIVASSMIDVAAHLER